MKIYEFELTFLCRGYGEWKEITKGIVNTIKDFNLEKEIEKGKAELENEGYSYVKFVECRIH